MKSLLYLVLLFSVILIGCKEKEMSIGEGQLRDGKLYQPNETEPFTGMVKSFDGFFTYKDGLLNGPAEFIYSDNGQQKIKMAYANNIPSGRLQTWTFNGTSYIDADYSKLSLLDKIQGTWITGKDFPSDDNRVFLHLDKGGIGYKGRVTTEQSKKYNGPILFNVYPIEWRVERSSNDEATIRYKFIVDGSGDTLQMKNLNYVSFINEKDKTQFNRRFITQDELHEMISSSRNYY